MLLLEQHEEDTQSIRRLFSLVEVVLIDERLQLLAEVKLEPPVDVFAEVKFELIDRTLEVAGDMEKGDPAY